MNTFRKFTTAAVMGVLALGSTGCAQAEQLVAQAHATTLGVGAFAHDVGSLTVEIGKLTAKIGHAIASEAIAHMQAAVNAPRVARVRRSPSVSVEQIETVVVVATRLPAREGVDESPTRTAQVASRVAL